MSEFDDIIKEGLCTLLDIVGRTSFKIGLATFQGDYTEFSAAASQMADGGGFTGVYPATILAEIAQFDGKFPAPLEKSLANLRLTIKGRTFRVEQAVVDATSVTLNLVNPDAAG